jgi:amino acid permease
MSFGFDVFLIVIFSLGSSYLYNWSRKYHPGLSAYDNQIVGGLIGLSAFIFSLLISFTISDLYQRYNTRRNLIADRIVKLKLTYQQLNLLPNTDMIIETMKKYLTSILKDSKSGLFNSSQNTIDLQNLLNQQILTYVRDNNTPFNLSLINDLDNKVTIDNQSTTTLITILILIAFLILLGLWFVNMQNNYVQFVLDFVVITIFTLAFYLIYEFTNPVPDSIFAVTDKPYEDLLNEINKL